MFKKCLKYDMRAFAKIWLIASAVVLIISILGGIGFSSFIGAITSMEELETQTEPEFWETALVFARMMIGMVCYIVFIYTLVIYNGGTQIMLLIRYYTKFFTDQGYLTFTLPVRRSTQFWSKAVSGLLYSTASGLMTILSVITVIISIFISLLIAPDSAQQFDLSQLTQLLQPATVAYALVACVLGVLLVTAINFASLMMQYLIITLAATMFRKLKVLSVIVAYYVVNNVIAIPIIYVGIYYVMIAAVFLIMGLTGLMTVPILGWLGIYAIMLLAALGAVTVGMILANFTMQRLERKLNLA